jgi:hypothetical protein
LVLQAATEAVEAASKEGDILKTLLAVQSATNARQAQNDTVRLQEMMRQTKFLQTLGERDTVHTMLRRASSSDSFCDVLQQHWSLRLPS